MVIGGDRYFQFVRLGGFRLASMEVIGEMV